MKIINTTSNKKGEPRKGWSDLSANETFWVYNGLDSMLTHEIHSVIDKELTDETRATYEFEKSMQGPVMEMMLRGVLIDHNKRAKWRETYEKELAKLERDLNKLAAAVWGKPLNAASPIMVQKFLYGRLKIPPRYKYERGEKKVTVDEDALEEIKAFFYAQPFCNNILKQRGIKKKLDVTRAKLDEKGRFTCSINIAGTETGRWSSSESSFRLGSNTQNVTDELREIFIADPGMKMAYIDLKQAESRAVGYLSEDGAYIQACEEDDLHIHVCTLIWPDLPWGQGNDEEVAEKLYHRHFSYRDLSKRGGHATNYYGKPQTISRHIHVPAPMVATFQFKYFTAFPGISQWHQDTITELQSTGSLTTPFGRKRCFFDRLWSESTWRKAIAFKPQSLIADILNTGLRALWQADICHLLLQIHDAVLIQYPEEKEAEVLKQAVKLLTVPIEINGKTMVIPCDVSCGWNWRKYKSGTNNDGLKKWEGSDRRKREGNPETSELGSVLSTVL